MNIEMKIYELIGIKKFKKIVLLFSKKIYHNYKFKEGNNYYIGTINIPNVIAFKKALKYNATVHLIALLLNVWCMYLFVITNLNFDPIIFIVPIVLNLYCIFLQRYNWLRINRFLNKYYKK